MAHRFLFRLANQILRLSPTRRWIFALLALSVSWVVVGTLSSDQLTPQMAAVKKDPLFIQANQIIADYENTFTPVVENSPLTLKTVGGNIDLLNPYKDRSLQLRSSDGQVVDLNERKETPPERRVVTLDQDSPQFKAFEEKFLALKQQIELESEKRSSIPAPSGSDQELNLKSMNPKLLALLGSISLYQETVTGLFSNFIRYNHAHFGKRGEVLKYWLFSGKYELTIHPAIGALLRDYPSFQQTFKIRHVKDDQGNYSKVQVFLPLTSMRQTEILTLQDPRTDWAYAKLLTAYVLQESITNRWALRKWDSVQGTNYSDERVEACGPELSSFDLRDPKASSATDGYLIRESLMVKELAAFDRYRDLRDMADRVVPAMAERPLLSDAGYGELLNKIYALDPLCRKLMDARAPEALERDISETKREEEWRYSGLEGLATVNLSEMNLPSDSFEIHAIADRMTWKAFEDRKTFLKAHLLSVLRACRSAGKAIVVEEQTAQDEEVTVRELTDEEAMGSGWEEEKKKPESGLSLAHLFTPNPDRPLEEGEGLPQAKRERPAISMPTSAFRSSDADLLETRPADPVAPKLVTPPAVPAKSLAKAKTSKDSVQVIPLTAAERKAANALIDDELARVATFWKVKQSALLMKALLPLDSPAYIRQQNARRFAEKIKEMEPAMLLGAMAQQVVEQYNDIVDETVKGKSFINPLGLTYSAHPFSGTYGFKPKDYKNVPAMEAQLGNDLKLLVPETPDQLSLYFARKMKYYSDLGHDDPHWKIAKKIQGTPLVMETMQEFFGLISERYYQSQGKDEKKLIMLPKACSPNFLGEIPATCQGRKFVSVGDAARAVLPKVIERFNEKLKDLSTRKVVDPRAVKVDPASKQANTASLPKKPAAAGRSTLSIEKPRQDQLKPVLPSGPKMIVKQEITNPAEVKVLFAEALAMIGMSQFAYKVQPPNPAIPPSAPVIDTFRRSEDFLRRRMHQMRTKLGLGEARVDHLFALSMTDQLFLAQTLRDAAFAEEPLLVFEPGNSVKPKNDLRKSVKVTSNPIKKKEVLTVLAHLSPLFSWKDKSWVNPRQVTETLQNMVQIAIRNDLGKVEAYCRSNYYTNPAGDFRKIYDVSAKLRELMMQGGDAGGPSSNSQEMYAKFDETMKKRSRSTVERLDQDILTPITMVALGAIGVMLVGVGGAFTVTFFSQALGISLGSTGAMLSTIVSLGTKVLSVQFLGTFLRGMGTFAWANIVGNLGLVGLAGTAQTAAMVEMYFFDQPAHVRFMYESYNSTLGMSGKLLSDRKAINEARASLNAMKGWTIFGVVAEGAAFKYWTLPGIRNSFGITGIKKAKNLMNFPGGEDLPKFMRQTFEELKAQHGSAKALDIWTHTYVLDTARRFGKHRVSALIDDPQVGDLLLSAFKKRLAHEVADHQVLLDPIQSARNKLKSEIAHLEVEMRELSGRLQSGRRADDFSERLKDFLTGFRVRGHAGNYRLVTTAGEVLNLPLENAVEFRHFFAERKLLMKTAQLERYADILTKHGVTKNSDEFFTMLTKDELVQFMDLIKKEYQKTSDPRWLAARKVYKDFKFLDEEVKNLPKVRQWMMMEAMTRYSNKAGAHLGRNGVTTNENEVREVINNQDVDVIPITAEDLKSPKAQKPDVFTKKPAPKKK